MSGIIGALVWNNTVVLTNAQIKALPTTPIQIAPAPGAGKVIVPEFAYLYAVFAGGAYTNLSDQDYIQIVPQGEAGIGTAVIADVAAQSIDTLTRLMAGTNKVMLVGQINQGSGTISSAWGPVSTSNTFTGENLPLQILAVTGAGNFTGGNAANTLAVNVFYRVIEL